MILSGLASYTDLTARHRARWLLQKPKNLFYILSVSSTTEKCKKSTVSSFGEKSKMIAVLSTSQLAKVRAISGSGLQDAVPKVRCARRSPGFVFLLGKTVSVL